MNRDLSNTRTEYTGDILSENNVNKDPIIQFEKWYQQIEKKGTEEPNIMTLSTIKSNNKPSSRIVLLKGIEDKGFTFFTNYMSEKGTELKQNPYAALNIFWASVHRQVRIEGLTKKLPTTNSDTYFKTRPRESQIGAWASQQSDIIESRSVLDEKFEAYKEKFGNNEIERPAHWGGYILIPSIIEFWQGRPNRLHDRIRYTYTDNQWKLERLAP